MILFRALIVCGLFPLFQCAWKGAFDPDLSLLEGLYCYQCEAGDEYCHTSNFLTSPKKAKLNMLIQCPHDCRYCLKKVTKKANSEEFTVDRSCSRGVDTIGQKVRPGCMLTKKMEVCLCKKNLCNCSRTTRICKTCLICCVAVALLYRYFNFFLI